VMDFRRQLLSTNKRHTNLVIPTEA
jgi:hypothetical protein